MSEEGGAVDGDAADARAGGGSGKVTQVTVHDVPMQDVDDMLEVAGVFLTWIGEDVRKKTEEMEGLCAANRRRPSKAEVKKAEKSGRPLGVHPCQKLFRAVMERNQTAGIILKRSQCGFRAHYSMMWSAFIDPTIANALRVAQHAMRLEGGVSDSRVRVLAKLADSALFLRCIEFTTPGFMGTREKVTRLFSEMSPMENMIAEKRVRNAALSRLPDPSRAALFSGTDPKVLALFGDPSPLSLSSEVVAALVSEHHRFPKVASDKSDGQAPEVLCEKNVRPPPSGPLHARPPLQKASASLPRSTATQGEAPLRPEPVARTPHSAPETNTAVKKKAPARTISKEKAVPPSRSVAEKEKAVKENENSHTAEKETAAPPPRSASTKKTAVKEKNRPKTGDVTKIAPPPRAVAAKKKKAAKEKDPQPMTEYEKAAPLPRSAPPTKRKAPKKVVKGAATASRRAPTAEMVAAPAVKRVSGKALPVQSKKRRVAHPTDSTSSLDSDYSSSSSSSVTTGSSNTTDKTEGSHMEEEEEGGAEDVCKVCGEEEKLVIKKSGKGKGKAKRVDDWVECALESHPKGTSSWAHLSCEGVTKSIGSFRKAIGDKDYSCKTCCGDLELWKAQWE